MRRNSHVRFSGGPGFRKKVGLPDKHLPLFPRHVRGPQPDPA